ncbi:ABC transporter substrate-binding protein [Rhodococcus sp. JS3073]|uniref:ABC transporter substrate-binding protein n=1 Tax=Rhodococcus sp. JS3073 TaxID=3002901 RepID=UPI00228637FE|nr:ABC transporter substrate-binding protein [Rhodococcus sp. JS3073]WAM19894.1 ABC transporter substrate-binding protein [Rhodococcus sp. JS3073]
MVGLTAVSGAGISLTSGCGSLLGKQRTNALVFVSDGGEYQAAQRDSWITPFSRSRPDLNVVEDVPKSYARLQAMVSSENVMWDLMTATGDFGYGVDRDYLVDFAGRDLPLGQLHPEYVGESRVGHAVFSNVLAYRTDLLGGKTPQGWADFFDLDRFPGRRGLRNFSAGAVMEIALIADGVDPHDLYPLDYKRAFAKLDTIKDHTVFWTSGAQSAQLISDGEVSMTQIWNGRVYNLQKQGAPIAIQWNQQFPQADALVVPRGANVDYAMDLARYILAPENNAKLSQYIPYGPTNRESLSLVEPAMRDHLPTSYMDLSIAFDNIWLNQNRDEVDSRWQSWVRAA